MASSCNASILRRFRSTPLLTSVGLLASIAGASPAWSQIADPPSQTGDEEGARDVVIVTGARNVAGVLQGRDSDAAFGLTMDLVEPSNPASALCAQLVCDAP